MQGHSLIFLIWKIYPVTIESWIYGTPEPLVVVSVEPSYVVKMRWYPEHTPIGMPFRTFSGSVFPDETQIISSGCPMYVEWNLNVTYGARMRLMPCGSVTGQLGIELWRRALSFYRLLNAIQRCAIFLMDSLYRFGSS